MNRSSDGTLIFSQMCQRVLVCKIFCQRNSQLTVDACEIKEEKKLFDDVATNMCTVKHWK